jgi:hypothetical protein
MRETAEYEKRRSRVKTAKKNAHLVKGWAFVEPWDCQVMFNGRIDFNGFATAKIFG